MKRAVKENINEGYGLEQAGIWIEETTCEVCGEQRDCLVMDGSRGEFFNGAICESCAMEAFKTPNVKSAA